jgi:GNAT superfamily N-acetyltransferase
MYARWFAGKSSLRDLRPGPLRGVEHLHTRLSRSTEGLASEDRQGCRYALAVITLAESDEERRDVLNLFLDVFEDIAPTAVPMRDVDHMYEPLIAQVRDDKGELIAGALTCRPQIAAGLSMLPEALRPKELARAAERVSELDLMAVRPDRRGEGLGQALVSYLEPLLVARGVRAWFGNVTPELEIARLRRFYDRAGFQVLANGQPLPPFGGQQWSPPGAQSPAFYFWKRPTK